MRLNHPLDYVLSSRSKVAVLRYLALSGLELSGREVARSVGLSPKPLNQVLGKLVEEGVLQQRVVGRTYLFKLNRGNRLAEDLLLPLFQKEQALLKQAVAEVVAGLPGLLSVILFGSVARGDAGAHSDVDLLIVADDSEAIEQIMEEKLVLFLERYGNVLSPIVWRREEFRQRFLRRDDFLREILTEGQVVAGLLPMELVYGSS